MTDWRESCKKQQSFAMRSIKQRCGRQKHLEDLKSVTGFPPVEGIMNDANGSWHMHLDGITVCIILSIWEEEKCLVMLINTKIFFNTSKPHHEYLFLIQT